MKLRQATNTISVNIEHPPLDYDLRQYVKFSDEDWDVETDSGGNLRTKPEVVITAHKNHELVGLLYVFPLEILFNNDLIISGGIGGIVTHLNYRHMGIASKLLKRSIGFLKRQNRMIALISTDITNFRTLYVPFGFVPLGRPYILFGNNEPHGMIAPVKSERIFNRILNSTYKIEVRVGSW